MKQAERIWKLAITYIADDDVLYSDILSWAEAKYKFFDYDLITD